MWSNHMPKKNWRRYLGKLLPVPTVEMRGFCEIRWVGCSLDGTLISIASFILFGSSYGLFQEMNVVESAEHLNADTPEPFLLTELLNKSFNFSKFLFLHL